MTLFDVAVFLPAGQVLLMGSFAYGLIKTMREDEDFSSVIETSLLAVLALTFYRDGAELVSRISGEFLALLKRVGGNADLMTQLAVALESAMQEQSKSPTLQMFVTSIKGGVWGTLMLVSQFLFMVVEGVFRLSQQVFWNLILVLFPLAAGLFPAFPFLLKSLIIYAIELSLWLPVLTLINYCAGLAAASPEVSQAPFGIGVAITQILVVVMILNVPFLTHRIMTGALSHLLGSGAPAVQKAKSLAAWSYGDLRPRADRVMKTVVMDRVREGVQ